MNWFSNLKIANKVTIFACLAVFFILIVGFVGYLSITNDQKGLERLTKNEFTPTINMMEVKSNTNEIKGKVCELLLTTNFAEKTNIVEEIKKN